jgi:hypothetical protein
MGRRIRLDLKIAKSVVYEDKPADWKKKPDKEVAQIQEKEEEERN